MNGPQPAWILTTPLGACYAVCDHEMLEFVDLPVCHPVPLAPRHCNQLVSWRGQLVPRFDFDALLGEASNRAAAVALVAYQDAGAEPLHTLALCVAGAPHRVVVSDTEACALPPRFADPALRPLACAAFEHAGSTVVIIDIAALAGAGGDIAASTLPAQPAEPA